jgi:hypothetical protein
MHQNAADRVLMYLYDTRHLSLRFGLENRLIIVSRYQTQSGLALSRDQVKPIK